MGDETLDVVIVGAGITGIGAAREFARAGRSYTVLEARSDLGGTWDLFRYPGIRSDSDMATFGYRSRPWAGDRALAPAAEILDYVRAAANERGVRGNIQFELRARRVRWIADDQLWIVESEHVRTGEKHLVTARAIFMATGYYRYDRGFTPTWPGAESFSGEVIHPQQWPEGFDPSDKNVVVIGSGATAITLVPALVERGARVTMLQRSPTYVATVPAIDRAGITLRRWLPSAVAGGINRWRNIFRGMLVYEFSKRSPKRVRGVLRDRVIKELGPDYPVDVDFNPRYDPWDQRLCATPDGDFFAAIRSGGAQVVTDEVRELTPGGISLASGREIPADVIVTATGLEILLFGGIEVVVDGQRVDLASRLSYRGMMLEGVPNLAFGIGYTNASWTLKIDLVTAHFRRILDRLDHLGATSVTPHYSGSRKRLRPLIDLQSGYLQRGAALMPRQTASGRWSLRQNYLSDRLKLRRGSESDPDLVYAKRPVPTPNAGLAAATSTRFDMRLRVSGEGPAVVLLHGIGRSLEDWAEQHDLLSGTHRVLSLDLPGFGHSAVPVEGMRLRVLADHVARLLEAENTGPAHIVGNSLGGAVAMQLATSYPHLVRSLLLVDAAGLGRNAAPFLRLATLPGLGEFALRRPARTAELMERSIFADLRFVTPERLALGRELWSRPGAASVFLRLVRSLGWIGGIKRSWRRRVIAGVRAARVPVMIVWGADDRVLPLSHLKLGAKALGATRTHVFPDTGHMPQIERANEFARLAQSYWSDIETAPPVLRPSHMGGLMDNFNFSSGAAVITGAASGIGRALALNLARRGSDLALIDRDEEGLAAVQAEIAAGLPGRHVTTHLADFSVVQGFDDLAAEVTAAHERIALLVNNAGVALGGLVADVSMDDIDWILTINLRSPIAVTKAFLPSLRETPGAHIVNLSSLFGLIGPAGQAGYAASKFGIRGFTQSLQAELIPQGIGVTVVHPGGIATSIAKNARLGAGVDPRDSPQQQALFQKLLKMSPEAAAAEIAEAIERRRERIVITRQARTLDRVVRLFPVRSREIVARGMKR